MKAISRIQRGNPFIVASHLQIHRGTGRTGQSLQQPAQGPDARGQTQPAAQAGEARSRRRRTTVRKRIASDTGPGKRATRHCVVPHSPSASVAMKHRPFVALAAAILRLSSKKAACAFRPRSRARPFHPVTCRPWVASKATCRSRSSPCEPVRFALDEPRRDRSWSVGGPVQVVDSSHSSIKATEWPASLHLRFCRRQRCLDVHIERSGPRTAVAPTAPGSTP